jgi:hypothetical protein
LDFEKHGAFAALRLLKNPDCVTVLKGHASVVPNAAEKLRGLYRLRENLRGQ